MLSVPVLLVWKPDTLESDTQFTMITEHPKTQFF